jgi:hypothetical protein
MVMKIEPNSVAIPPLSAMNFRQRAVISSQKPRQKVRGKYMVTMNFFSSLAADRGSQAIAIVLSGVNEDAHSRTLTLIDVDGIADCRRWLNAPPRDSSGIAKIQSRHRENTPSLMLMRRMMIATNVRQCFLKVRKLCRQFCTVEKCNGDQLGHYKQGNSQENCGVNGFP